MEEGDGCEESLFSLEFLVESVNVEPRLVPAPVPACGPFRLAVALRLLDFPTLLVRAPHCGPGPVVPFGRGKSCLFKLRPTALKSLLRRSPLCALLLALPPTPGAARLLGSSSVSLASAAEELLLGTGPGGRRGRFPLRDLMGEFIGELGLSYRLNNLGVALLDHLGQGAAPRESLIEEPPQPPSPLPLLQKPKQLLFGSPPPPPPSPSPCHIPDLTGIQNETMLNLELIPKGEEDQDLATDGGSMKSYQSSSTSSSSTDSHSYDLECGDQARLLETQANVFCPPPLYYSNTPGTPSHTPRAPRHAVRTPSHASRSPSPTWKPPKPAVAAMPQISSKKKEVTIPPMSPAQKVQQKEPPSGMQETGSSNPAPNNPELLKQTLNQLPLLNALLLELSLLNNQTVEPGPCTVHPQLAWLYKNAEDNAKPPSPSAKSPCPNREEKKTSHHHKEREKSPSPRLKKNRPDHFGNLSPTFHYSYSGKGYAKSIGYERPGSPEKYNTKENTPPRRKLKYGLTNTLRLRLQRTNPTLFMTPEKQFHHRKKHTEGEKKGKSSSSRVKTPRSSPDRRLKSARQPTEKVNSEENSHEFNDNIETLIQNSVDQDCYKAKKKVPDCYTAVKEVTSELQSNVTTGMKDIENTKEKGPSEVTESGHIEKCLKIRLPRVSMQIIDVKNKTNVETEKCVQNSNCNITARRNPSQSSSFENNKKLKNEDEVVASYENTIYSDDFTGTDSSSTSLDAPENSPDPVEETPEQNQSVTDSNAKVSERSLTPDVSLPLPIPCAVSPVLSLKKTSDIKSSGKNTFIGLSVLDRDGPCATTVKEELAIQHVKKDEKKEVVKMEGKQVSFDVDGNLAEDVFSVEKSQSLRTSQVSSYLPSSMSDLDLSGLEESKTSNKEADDNIEMLDVISQCKHVSELVVSNLPGYTM